MPAARDLEITFVRLTEVPIIEILEHMSDPRVAEHMPLLQEPWDIETATKFVALKEECWHRDGLGHWAILAGGRYVGWGGLQKEGSDWDFGLVLKPDEFGLGPRLTRKVLNFARSQEMITHVTFLLPPSRQRLAALERLGARFVADVFYDGAVFKKFRLDLSSPA